MIKVQHFQELAAILEDIFTDEKGKREEFLSFYRQLVETLPTEVCEAFGNMDVDCQNSSGKKAWGLELTVSDFLFWKENLSNNCRFILSYEKVKSKMLLNLSKVVEEQPDLSVKAKRQLLKIVVDGSSQK